MGILRDLKRLRFWKKFLTHFFAVIGGASVVVGIIDGLFPQALENFAWLVWLILAIAGVYALLKAWPRPVEITFDSPKTSIRVIRGDLFEQDTHLAVGVCDTFDTASPFISQQSVQWYFQSRVYGGEISRLDAEIDAALNDAVPISSMEKPGKTSKYELGSVVTLRSLAKRYFLVAYSEMDERNKADATVDGLWKSLANLWSEVRNESNGNAVSIPVIGGGQSGLSAVLTPDDSIRLTALSFMIASRKRPVCGELRIVALPALYDKLNHLELQAFLSSLSKR